MPTSLAYTSLLDSASHGVSWVWFFPKFVRQSLELYVLEYDYSTEAT